jgi:GTPase SAR1 family protein
MNMGNYYKLKTELIRINQDIQSLFLRAKSIPRMSDYSFGDWEKTCASLDRQLTEEVVRVAVVGPIKSGKSTLINSILRGDFLKRGAGVVTSIVTRIRSGQRLKARLYFKTWQEINADMEQALVLFPSLNRRSEVMKFDVRQENERRELRQALKSLDSGQLIKGDTRSINTVVLTLYLKGYDAVSDIISADTIREFKDDRFADHKEFVGKEELAVYLKDVQLEICSSGLEADIELADCQGSDSSNPLHLAMIQDYLLLTHLIVYVISSRTGLRQADIKFLTMIKKIGILDNVLFVINCDFSEHESIADLNGLIRKVQEELAMITPKPDIYAFSALFNLFSAQADTLSAKDRTRLNNWDADRDLVSFSGRETGRFESVFYDKLTRRRNTLLLKNHLDRLDVMLSGMDNWIGINQDVLSKDSQSVQEIIKKLKNHQGQLSPIKTLINTTLAGAGAKLNQKLGSEANRFFDMHSGEIINEIFKFIKNYNELPDLAAKKIDLSVFAKTMYLTFQGFKQSLDSFLTEVINPEVIRFIKTKENEIKENAEALIQPFEVMLCDAYAEYNRLMEQLGVAVNFEGRPSIEIPDMDALIRKAGLRPPTLAAAMRYSAGIKSTAIVRFGFLNLQRNFKKLLKRPVRERYEVVNMALRGGIRQMKRESLKSIGEHLKDYRENLKFGYFARIVECTTNNLAEILVERFQVYFNDLSTVVSRISRTREDKQKAAEVLTGMRSASNGIRQRLQRLKAEIEFSD